MLYLFTSHPPPPRLVTLSPSLAYVEKLTLGCTVLYCTVHHKRCCSQALEPEYKQVYNLPKRNRKEEERGNRTKTKTKQKQKQKRNRKQNRRREKGVEKLPKEGSGT